MRTLNLRAAMLLVIVPVFGCEDSAADPAGPESNPAPRVATAPLYQAIPPDIDGPPQGFSVTVLSPRSTYPDQVDATFKIKLDGRRTIVAHAKDASQVVFMEITFAEGGHNGWHTHPGIGTFAVRSGRLGLINANDCVVRIYEPGQAFLDPGKDNVHVAFNALPEGEGETVIVGGFIGLAPGEPVSTLAPSPGC